MASSSSAAAFSRMRSRPSLCFSNSFFVAAFAASASSLGVTPKVTPPPSPRVHSGPLPLLASPPSASRSLSSAESAPGHLNPDRPATVTPGDMPASRRRVYAATVAHVLNVHPLPACTCATCSGVSPSALTPSPSALTPHGDLAPRSTSDTIRHDPAMRPSRCCLSSSSAASSGAGSSIRVTDSVLGVSARSSFAASLLLVPPHLNTLPSAQSVSPAPNAPSRMNRITPSNGSPLKSPHTTSPAFLPAPSPSIHLRLMPSACRNSHLACITRRWTAPGWKNRCVLATTTEELPAAEELPGTDSNTASCATVLTLDSALARWG